MKVTIAFADDELYRAIRVRAAQAGRPIRDLVEEALEMWLTAQEDAEDVAAAKDALAEPGDDIDAREYFQKLVAEGRAHYGDSTKVIHDGLRGRPATGGAMAAGQTARTTFRRRPRRDAHPSATSLGRRVRSSSPDDSACGVCEFGSTPARGGSFMRSMTASYASFASPRAMRAPIAD